MVASDFETPHARVDRMEAEGLVSPAQAEMLRSSLRGETRAASPQARAKGLPGTFLLVAGAVGVSALITFFVAFSGDAPPEIQNVAEQMNEPGGYGAMNKSLSTILAIALLLVLPLIIWVWLHNSLVGREEKVFEAWADTQSTLQRRADLIPALVETVTRYLKHERETLEGVTEVRSEFGAEIERVLEALIEANQKSGEALQGLSREALQDEALLARLFAAQGGLSRGITSVLATAEAYPDLKSGDQFLELQAQLEGTENRINVARIRFNEAVADYNAAMRRLPGSLVASVGGFQRKAYFRSEEEARDAPELAFD